MARQAWLANAVATLACVASIGLPNASPGEEKLALWFNAPAQNWSREALPIGNGRMGAMIFGGVDEEHIQFNEDSLWIGDEKDTGAYQNFGDIFISFTYPTSGKPQAYRRELDIARAIHTIRYKLGQVEYHRVYFASHPDDVVVLHFDASKPAAYTGKIRLVDAHRGTVSVAENRLVLKGDLSGYVYRPRKGGNQQGYEIALKYEAQLWVLAKGGKLKAISDGIAFSDCDSLTLLLCAGTNYVPDRSRNWQGTHPHERILARLEAAAAKSLDELIDRHVQDYRSLFDRLTIDLGSTASQLLQRPTNERLAEYRAGAQDPDLEELLFQYARYLMISSSRPGDLPANLQGVWNNSNNPPWRSDYHTDVNIEMNYWFVDAANLSECYQPLVDWLYAIREVRKIETKSVLGVRGWAMHAENGIFGGSTWRLLKGDAAWVAQNIWDHYRFTQDENYLRQYAYPILKELCLFWVDMLKPLPDGTLVSPEGFSPEHGPVEDGVSYEQELVWDLFTNYLEASEILGIDQEFRAKIADMRRRLLVPRIGKWGQLQEWMVDRDNPKDTHRHLSHLVGLYPGRQFSLRYTPRLAEAARVSLNARGDGGPGWSKAWKACLWARLYDGNRAYSLLRKLITENMADNLFNHSPFQIDANFGYAAAVCEMLLQSHLDTIDILPALPDAWANGHIHGIRARGGLVIDMDWKGGRPTSITITSRTDQKITLNLPPFRPHGKPVVVELKSGQPETIKFPLTDVR